MFYLNTIVQLFLFVEQLDQLEVCLSFSRLPAGIPILAVFQNLRWNSIKTSLLQKLSANMYSTYIHVCMKVWIYVKYRIMLCNVWRCRWGCRSLGTCLLIYLVIHVYLIRVSHVSYGWHNVTNRQQCAVCWLMSGDIVLSKLT